jgi:hypothetical protein
MTVTIAPRRGDWIQTYSGRQFWPIDPRPDEVDIEDIAHALSMQCRYAGHCLAFYSVAEHCVHLARHVSAPAKRWALLHDAAEAYLVDVPRPVKPHLYGYKSAEARVMQAIAKRFGLDGECPREVDEADRRILVDEALQIMAPPPVPWAAIDGLKPLGVKLALWPPHVAREEFLTLFADLYFREAA